MKADRETNRLPLRAGAMLLLAIAVVCIGLGWHSAVSDGDDGASELAEAGKSASATASAPPANPSTQAPPSSTADVDAAAVGDMCVLNAGTITGLAGETSDALKSAGFSVTDVANLSSASVTENTVFYDAGQEDAAQTVADSVPGGASLTERPAAFTRCAGELVVVVVSR